MSLMPSDAYMVAAGRTQAEFKVALETQRDCICEMPGGELMTNITIDGSDQITPVVGAQYYSVLVNSGLTDDLRKIIPTNCRNGYRITLRCNDPAKPIVIKHRAGGANQISCLGDQDYILDDLDKTFEAIFNDTTDVWEEVSSGSNRLELQRMPGWQDRSALSVASDIITITQFNHMLTPQSGTSDNVQEINWGTFGGSLFLAQVNNAPTNSIVFKHNTGAGDKIFLRGAADVTMNSAQQYILFERRGADAYEIARSGFVSNIPDGGTGNASLGVAANGFIVGDGTKLIQTVPSAAKSLLRRNSAGSGMESVPGNLKSMDVRLTHAGYFSNNTLSTILTTAVTPSQSTKICADLIVIANNATPDLKFAFLMASGNFAGFAIIIENGQLINALAITDGTPVVVQLAANATYNIKIGGVLTGHTANTLELQAAQNTSHGSNLTIYAGSSMTAQES